MDIYAITILKISQCILSKEDNSDTIYHFYDKLLNLTDLMNTENARKIAKKRTIFMKEFLNQFYNEWDGKDL